MNKKIKQQSKKLTLSTETLRNLSDLQIQQVAGGATRFCNSETYACSGCQPCA